MKDDEIRAHFNGRGCVELLPGHAAASKQRCIGDIAHALGYRLLAPRASAVSASDLSMNATTPRTPAAGQSRPSNGYAQAAQYCRR
jgi:hypothetical protein